MGLTLILWVMLHQNFVSTGPPICGKSPFHKLRFKRDPPMEPTKVLRIEEFPFIASVRTYIREDELPVDDGTFVGTLLNEYVVLVSCCCVVKQLGQVGKNVPKSLRDPRFFGVIAGTIHDLPWIDSQCQFRWGWRIQIHHLCEVNSENETRHDLAIITVEEPFKFNSSRMRPIPLPMHDFRLDGLIAARANCAMLGWGWEAYGYKNRFQLISPPGSLQLLMICPQTTPTMRNVSCIKFPLAARYTGDVGSPITCALTSGDRVLVGIRQNSEEIGNSSKTVPFTRFDDADTMKWILNATANFVRPPGRANSQRIVNSNLAVAIVCCILSFL